MKIKLFCAAMSLVLLGACEVDVLDPAVQGPAQRAALASAAGGVSGGQVIREGMPLMVHLTDGGYTGGDQRDMDSYRPVALYPCFGASCPKPAGADFGVTDCQRSGDRVRCRERDPNSGRDVGLFDFYGDQRYGFSNPNSGEFYSGVWYQTPQQRARAERQYSTMIDTFESVFAENFARVSDERNAGMDTLIAVGEASIAANTPGAGAGATSGGPVAATTTMEGDYIRINHPYADQARSLAGTLSCSAAQSLPTQAGAACEGFRNMVMLEACKGSVVTPAQFNELYPQFFEIAEGFANQGSNFRNMCGL